MFHTSDHRMSLGLLFATATLSKPPTPKPSCPTGLIVRWAPANTGRWMCCKNSDFRGGNDCKPGQAPFPYGPRHKLVCCQCPAGQVLNNDMNGCVPTEVPSPSTTTKPTPSPSAVPGTTPSRPTPPRTYQPTPSAPTPQPTYQPTPAPTYRPTQEGTADPTPKICGSTGKYSAWASKDLLYKGSGDKKMTATFRMCCYQMGNLPTNNFCEIPINALLYDTSYNKLCCYCIDGQTWKNGTPPECS
jgi:hypothetical protein